MIKLNLQKKISNPLIIEGFPGFGLVGTITTEFLIDHLQCEKIGTYYFEDLPATLAIHDNKIVDPVGIYYNSKFNLIIIHSISGAQGIEWKASDLVLDIAAQVKAKEIISIEGVGSPGAQQSRIFYYTTDPKKKEILDKAGMKPLSEGIIMGVTSAVMLKTNLPLTCLFAETESNLPDSKAAASVIQMLDNFLKLDIDPKPLLKSAEKFEQKVRSIMEQNKTAQQERDKKQLSYVG